MMELKVHICFTFYVTRTLQKLKHWETNAIRVVDRGGKCSLGFILVKENAVFNKSRQKTEVDILSSLIIHIWLACQY